MAKKRLTAQERAVAVMKTVNIIFFLLVIYMAAFLWAYENYP